MPLFSRKPTPEQIKDFKKGRPASPKVAEAAAAQKTDTQKGFKDLRARERKAHQAEVQRRERGGRHRRSEGG